MPKNGDVHVVPAGNNWRIEVEGQSRVSRTHDRQADAWQQARQIAQRNKSEACCTADHGQIRQRNTYGADPRPDEGIADAEVARRRSMSRSDQTLNRAYGWIRDVVTHHEQAVHDGTSGLDDLELNYVRDAQLELDAAREAIARYR